MSQSRSDLKFEIVSRSFISSSCFLSSFWTQSHPRWTSKRPTNKFEVWKENLFTALGLPSSLRKVAFTILVIRTEKPDSRKGVKFSLLVTFFFFFFFQSFFEGQSASWDVAKKDQNRAKNRYGNIIACKFSYNSW